MTGKQALRQSMKARRKAVPADVRSSVSRAVCQRLLGREDVRAAIAFRAPLAVYLASADEIDLSDFIVSALRERAVLAAPRWNGKGYELARLTSLAAVKPGPHGILEPDGRQTAVDAGTVSVWLVPGLAFTDDGRRLGYGGGWYDRLLADAAPSAMTLGVTYDWQVVDDLPCEPHDVRLHGLVPVF